MERNKNRFQPQAMQDLIERDQVLQAGLNYLRTLENYTMFQGE